MVILAIIYRTSDGLPLSASTDHNQRPDVRECQKYVKLLSRKASQLPDRSTLRLQGFEIHLISALGLTFLTLTEEAYPTVLAFCFLDELQKDFLVKYDGGRVQSAKRPYAFIEYDMVIQKTKQKFNSPRSLTTRINLTDMTTEFKLRPPYEVTESDLGIVSNGSRYGHGNHSTPHHREKQQSSYNDQSFMGNVASSSSELVNSLLPTGFPVSPEKRLIPLSVVGTTSLMLALFCAVLNLVRGTSILIDGHYDEDYGSSYKYGVVFLIACLLSLYQVYMLLCNASWTVYVNVLIIAGIVLCNLYLLHWRDTWTLLFHFTVAAMAAYSVHRRKTEGGLPHYAI